MDIDPESSTRLRAILCEIDASKLARQAEADKISAATAASARVRRLIAEMDADLDRLSNTRIDVEAERLAHLIAGESVPQAEAGDIEIRAAEARRVKAHRRQSADDLAALEEHLRRLNASLTTFDTQIERLEAGLYSGLGEAILVIYKQAAIKFVAENVPYLRSIAHKIQAATGMEPAWAGRALFRGALSIQWRDEELTQETQWHQKSHAPVHVWPRPDTERLLSGEPFLSGALIDDLIERLRLQEPSQTPEETPHKADIDRST